MEAILKFSLPQEEWEFDKAVGGKNLHLAVFEFKNRMRSFLKHDDDATDDHQDFYDMFLKVLDEYNVNLD
jgi:hypothetical protein